MKDQKNYWRVMPGKKYIHIEKFVKDSFIGVYGETTSFDLSKKFPEGRQQFFKKCRSFFLKHSSKKTKQKAGQACGTLYRICKDISKGDIVLCPDDKGAYFVGEITSGYVYRSDDGDLIHRRLVEWSEKQIVRADMSSSFQKSARAGNTIVKFTEYADEIEPLITRHAGGTLALNDESLEGSSVSPIEKFLEKFLINNWNSCALGKTHDIYQDDNGVAGRQYPTDTGYIDILAISKDKSELLIVELKKGKASDAAVGQVQRHMGYVDAKLKEKNQTVRGCIIALEDDLRIKYALRVAKNIDFYRYQVSFKLIKS